MAFRDRIENSGERYPQHREGLCFQDMTHSISNHFNGAPQSIVIAVPPNIPGSHSADCFAKSTHRRGRHAKRLDKKTRRA